MTVGRVEHDGDDRLGGPVHVVSVSQGRDQELQSVDNSLHDAGVMLCSWGCEGMQLEKGKASNTCSLPLYRAECRAAPGNLHRVSDKLATSKMMNHPNDKYSGHVTVCLAHLAAMNPSVGTVS